MPAHQAVCIARVVVAINVRELAAWVALHGALQGAARQLGGLLVLRLHAARASRGTPLCRVASMPLLPRQSMTGANRLSMSSESLELHNSLQCCAADCELLTVQSLGVQGPPESVRIAALTARM